MKVWLKINIHIEIAYLEYMYLKGKKWKIACAFYLSPGNCKSYDFLPCNFKLSLSAWLYRYIVFKIFTFIKNFQSPVEPFSSVAFLWWQDKLELVYGR